MQVFGVNRKGEGSISEGLPGVSVFPWKFCLRSQCSFPTKISPGSFVPLLFPTTLALFPCYGG